MQEPSRGRFLHLPGKHIRLPSGLQLDRVAVGTSTPGAIPEAATSELSMPFLMTTLRINVAGVGTIRRPRWPSPAPGPEELAQTAPALGGTHAGGHRDVVVEPSVLE